MDIDVELPDGSLASFPQGTPPETMQAEIERYLASAPPPQMTPHGGVQPPAAREPIAPEPEPAPPPQQMPMNEMERLYASGQIAPTDRRPIDPGPPRRSPERQPYQPPQIGPTELNTPRMRDAMDYANSAPAPQPTSPPRRNAEISIRNAAQPQGEQMPMNEMERMYQSEAQRVGPPRRRADVNIRQQAPAAPAPQDRGNVPVREVNPDGTAFQQDWQAYRRDSDIVAGVENIKTGLLQGDYGYSARPASQTISSWADYFTKSPEGGAKAKSEREKVSAAFKWYDSPEAAEFFRQNPDALNAANQDPVAFFEAQAGGQQPAPSTPQQAGAAQAQPAAGEGAARQTRVGASTQDPRVAMPRGLSTQEARRNAPLAVNMSNGDTVPLQKITKKAMRNAEQSGTDFLVQNIDRVILARMRVGDIDGAMKLREWAEGEKAAKGMKYMNRTVAAATYGDNDAFVSSLDNMVKSFDGDGAWQVDTKGTTLIDDGEGNAVGARLVLRNKETGERMEQEYMGMQNVLSGISRWGDPMGQFAAEQERVAGAINQRIARAKSYQEAYNEAAEAMFGDDWVDMQGNAINEEEAARRHKLIQQRIQTVRPDIVPENRRVPDLPATAGAPGAASGVGAVTGGTNNQPVPTWAD